MKTWGALPDQILIQPHSMFVSKQCRDQPSLTNESWLLRSNLVLILILSPTKKVWEHEHIYLDRLKNKVKSDLGTEPGKAINWEIVEQGINTFLVGILF